MGPRNIPCLRSAPRSRLDRPPLSRHCLAKHGSWPVPISLVVLSALRLWLAQWAYRRLRPRGANEQPDTTSDAITDASFAMLAGGLGMARSRWPISKLMYIGSRPSVAKDLYRLLPDTIRVSFKTVVVPVPLRTLVSEDDFVLLVEHCFHDTEGGLAVMQH
jgi:hypothetical protein